MAFFRFSMQRIARAAGRSAPAAAAYRAGERIRDLRTGVLHNYARRTDVVHKQILLPESLPPGAARWALDRAQLWNVAEAAEGRSNSIIAREYQLSLPHELDAERRVELARGFAQEIANRHRIVVDLAVHGPKPEGDPRNFHAHLLVTTREVTAAGLGAKAGLDQSYARSEAQGLLGRAELGFLRERWAHCTNEAYRAAGLELRVDHRTLAAQGIGRVPSHRSFVAVQIERRRLRRERLEALAERYAQRVLDGRERSGALTQPSASSLAIERARQLGREAWQALRRGHAPGGPTRTEALEARSESATLDEDQAL